MREELRHAPIGVLETTTSGEITAVNESAAELLAVDRERLRGSSIDESFPQSASGTLHAAFAGDEPAERSFEEYYPEIDRWLVVDLVRTDDTVFVYLRDQSQRREDQHRIETLTRRLEQLDTIDSLVATVLRKVIGASDREEIATEICDQLGAAEHYEFTWVGERDFSNDRLRVVASAGDAPEMLDRLEEQLDGDGDVPERVAFSTGETRMIQRLADDDSVPRGVRLAAFGRGLQSCIAVPLTYGETVYGVLSVYSAQKTGFSEQERRSLETLGAVAGFAVNAIRQEDRLFADTVTELTLSVRDGSVPFVAVSGEDRRLTLDGAVSREDDTVVCYVRADGESDEFVDALRKHDAISGVRTVQDSDETTMLQVAVTGATPVTVLLAWGATVRTATYAGDEARLVAELPADTDLRRVVEAVGEEFDDTELLAKQERSHDPTTKQAFRNDLRQALTDKQLTVLETAYFADYFDSPRGSTSEEVGEALDIAGPTVLYHLRKSQRKLLSAFFEDTVVLPPADEE